MESTWAMLAGGAFLAGFVDAVAGGGGLIQLPLLLAVLPATPPATLFGTNKAAAIWGTLTAAAQYVRRVRLRWCSLGPALVAALIAAWCGARAVTRLPAGVLRPAVLVLLIAVAWYTFSRHDLGRRHAPTYGPREEAWRASAISAGLGFYDGVFGPGTGAFLVFSYVRLLGYDFLHASAAAKVINVGTNLAALAYFAPSGRLLWPLAGLMAVSNITGAVFGSRAALRHGSGFVRGVFLVVVAALIGKLALDTLRGR
jgi:uncharacterized membrane protein YfcA